MPEKPIVPPTRKPVSEFPTPDPSVAFYTELVNRDDIAYYANAPMKRGMLYSTIVGAKREVIAMYPQLFFLKEVKYAQNDQLVLWHWATDEQAHDTYNSTDTYVQNAVTFPAYTRTYTVRRELYEAEPTIPIGSPLPGIISVTITSPGQNYTKAYGVINGTSVAIQFTVSSTGSLLNGIITNTGEELIQDKTAITIIGDGQDGSAYANAQPVGCVLTAQTKQELDDNDPIQHELVKVIRVYETLPGPWIYTTRMDKDGDIVTSKTRRQVTAFITDQDSVLGGIWSQTFHKAVDDFISEETIENRPVPGNPIISTHVEEDGDILTSIKTLIDVTQAVNSETLVTGVWTKNYIQEVDDSTLIKVHQASNKVAWQMSDSRAIPGNVMETTRIDNDGVVIFSASTLSEASTIVDGETLVGGTWTKTTQSAVSDLVGKKIVEHRRIAGNPVPSSRIDEDSVPVSIVTTYENKLSVITAETLIAGVWTHTKAEHCTSDMGVSDLVVDQVVESRAIPGNSVVSTRVEEDGMITTISKTLGDTTTIVSQEVIDVGIWIKTHKEEVSDLVANQVIESRPVPGNPVVSIKVDKDGKPQDVIKTLKDTLTVTPSETIGGLGVWVKVEKEAVSDLVCNEVVTARDAQGNNVFSSGVDGDLEVEDITTVQRNQLDITPSSTESGGFITTVEKKDITDLLADEVTTVTKWLDKASYSISIINLIPREFMAFIPTFTVSHILAGIASQPVLGTGEFEHSQRQLNKLLYEDRITSLGAISLPITHTNKELTEEYGGGVLNVSLTLDITGAQTIDQGYLVTRSTLTVLGNGMDVKETAQLDGTEWPILTNALWDDNMRLYYTMTEQVVPFGSSPAPDPGGVFAWLSEIKEIDTWRVKRINTSKPTPAYTDKTTALITYQMNPFAYPGYVLNNGFGYYVRTANAKLIQHTIRTWWVKSATTPTSGPTGSGADVEFDPIVVGSIIINNLSNTGLTYAENVLHGDFTYGTIFWAATTPTAAEYFFGTQTGTTITNLLGLFNPGTGYAAGDSLSFSGDGGFATVTVTAVGVSNGIIGYTPISGSFGWSPAGTYGPYAASGGVGTGAQFHVIAVEIPVYDPSTKWIGQPHVVGASVSPEKETDIWKITTETVTME